MKPFSILTITATFLLLAMEAAHATCIDHGDGTYTCSGTSDNNDTMSGAVVLDNTGSETVLSNSEMVGGGRGVIQNDNTSPSMGEEHTISITGNQAAMINNLDGLISFSRPSLNTSLFSHDAAGVLLYNGNPAGMGAAIYGHQNTPSIVIDNDTRDKLFGYAGEIITSGNFTAAIYGSAQEFTITNNDVIRFQSYASGSDTFKNGQWAIATYGGATYSAPSVLDGTQYATVLSSGLTTINNTAYIFGDILILDKNPLLTAAQQIDNTLVLEYGSDDVGPRDSILNNTVSGTGLSKSFGYIQGNIYLGSGNHVINNGTLDGAGVAALIDGNIIVDQRDSAVVDVSGGVASTQYLVSGGKTFTFNQMAHFTGDITLHDVVGSVNNINIYAGISTADGESDNPAFNLTADGLGTNNLNLYCLRTVANGGCSATGGNWSGLTALNILGTKWDFSDAAKTVSLVGGDINIESRIFLFGGSMIADNVIVNSRMDGVYDFNNISDHIGTITGNLINNGMVSVRDATLVVNGDATFNAGSVFSLRVNGGANGMLDVVDGTGLGTFSDASKVIVSAHNYYFHTGDTFTIATNSSGSPIIQGPGALVNFTSSDATGDIVLTANVAIPSNLNVTVAGNNALSATVNYSGNDAGLVELQQQLQTLDAAELKRAAERLRPEINDSLIRMTMNHTDRVLGVVESHLFDTYLANVKGEPRVPIDGKLPTGSGIWFQGFGGYGTQDLRKNADGYSATSTGIAAGIDRLVGIGDDLRVGLAGAYAYGNIDNSGITDNNRTNINSYMGIAYGAMHFDPWYLNAAIGLGRHTYDTERIALGRSAEAQHESWQVTAKIDAGWPIQYNDLWTFVPLASFSYNRINEDGYTEHGKQQKVLGAGIYNPGENLEIDSAINLQIDKKTYNSYRSGMGGKVLLSLQEPSYNAGVELRAMYVHEFGDLTNNSVARFTHGGATFYSPGIAPARGGIILGSSVRLTGNDENDQLTLLASYDADFRDKYFGQSLTLMLRYDFDQGPSYIKKAIYRATEAQNRIAAVEKKVTATDRDVMQMANAMAGPSQDMLAYELSSDDPQVRASAIRKQAVQKAVDNWLNAMLNGNLTVYFNTYAADFVNEDGLSRQQWERKRKKELQDTSVGSFRITDMTVKAFDGRASTIYTQVSAQNGQVASTRKILELEERNGRWLIVSEDSVPLSGWNSAAGQ